MRDALFFGDLTVRPGTPDMATDPEKQIHCEDAQAPKIYLCQVNQRVSCGACCGLYNIPGLSRESLYGLLRQRTDAFSLIPRTVDAIDDFMIDSERLYPTQRPFPQFHHCRFLGLIGEDLQTVGCLLHPMARGNCGKDWRGLSYYGGMACRTYFCPSTRQLPSEYLMILRQSLDDWYLYGLIVTERFFLEEFFRLLEQRIGRKVSETEFPSGSVAAALFKEFAGLKLAWPHRRKDSPGPCNYFFENGEYPRPDVKRNDGSIPVSRYERLFKELESEFFSVRDLHRAESILNSIFDRLTVLLKS